MLGVRFSLLHRLFSSLLWCGLNAITKEAWNTAHTTEDKREKLHALSLAKECYSMKLDLLTNATVVDDAIRFVYQKSKEKKESMNNNNSSDD